MEIKEIRNTYRSPDKAGHIPESVNILPRADCTMPCERYRLYELLPTADNQHGMRNVPALSRKTTPKTSSAAGIPQL